MSTPRTAKPSLFARVVSRALAERYATLHRDVRTVATRLAGHRPPPYTTRGATAAPRALATRHLRVVDVVRETADAVTLWLEDVAGTPVAFTPGEFLTVLVTVDGEPLRRAYSLSSSALACERVSITVKRVPGGRVSNHVNDCVRTGDVLEVLGPSGSFTVAPDAAARRHVVLIAGGSGVTPMMAIARAVLAVEPASYVSLLYGNRRAADVLFADALAALAAAHPARFALRHALSEPPADWGGVVGMLDRDTVAREVAALPACGEVPADYYVCGPEAMMAEARVALLENRGVPAARVHEERFGNPAARAVVARDAGARRALLVTIRTAAATRDVVVPSPQTLLEAGLAAGLPMPYSCGMGGCGECTVQLREGEVEMDEPNCLSPAERAAGYVLTCVGRPVTAVVVEVPRCPS